MPYFLVSSTKEAHVKADNEEDAIMEFCTSIDQDHSEAKVIKLDPEDKDDAKTIKCIDETYTKNGLDDDEDDDD